MEVRSRGGATVPSQRGFGIDNPLSQPFSGVTLAARPEAASGGNPEAILYRLETIMQFQAADTLKNRTFVGLIVAQFLASFNDQAIHASAMFFAINTKTMS